MPTIAELLADGSAERLARARREAERYQAEAEAEPVQPAACKACGRPFPPAPVTFRAPSESGPVEAAPGRGPMRPGI